MSRMDQGFGFPSGSETQAVMSASDLIRPTVAWSLSPPWKSANTNNSWRGEVRLGEVLVQSGRVAVPSPQPSPPKGIGDVAMMHIGGEGAKPAASWLMEIPWQLPESAGGQDG